MYLERFDADGYLDADRVEVLCLEANRYVSRIVLIIGGRRVLAQNLPWCWEDLHVAPGTPIALEVSSGRRGLLDDEQRAVAGFADRFRELLIPPTAGRRGRRWWRRH